MRPSPHKPVAESRQQLRALDPASLMRGDRRVLLITRPPDQDRFPRPQRPHGAWEIVLLRTGRTPAPLSRPRGVGDRPGARPPLTRHGPRVPHKAPPNPCSMLSLSRVGTDPSKRARLHARRPGRPGQPGHPGHPGHPCHPGYPSTTTAAPPRRGSPPPQNAPPASRSTACTPPKNRLSSRNRASPRPSPSIPSTATPGSV
jgi:hypothetical protein